MLCICQKKGRHILDVSPSRLCSYAQCLWSFDRKLMFAVYVGFIVIIKQFVSLICCQNQVSPRWRKPICLSALQEYSTTRTFVPWIQADKSFPSYKARDKLASLIRAAAVLPAFTATFISGVELPGVEPGSKQTTLQIYDNNFLKNVLKSIYGNRWPLMPGSPKYGIK